MAHLSAQTELDAVNTILASVGQAPVTTIDISNPEVALVYNTLLQVSREVQAEGWSFNREYDYPLPVSNSGHVGITFQMLQVALSPDRYRGISATVRNARLYNKSSHTDVWDEEQVYCDIVWLYDWESLPQPIKDYIVARASSQAASRVLSDANQMRMLQENEFYTRSQALEHEAVQGQYTFFGAPRHGNYYTSYEPYKALYR